MDEIWKLLVTYGPGGVIAGLVILALIAERKDHKADSKSYDDEIKAKDAAHIETLNKWRSDTQVQNDKLAALAEKVIIAIETSKRGQ